LITGQSKTLASQEFDFGFTYSNCQVTLDTDKIDSGSFDPADTQ